MKKQLLIVFVALLVLLVISCAEEAAPEVQPYKIGVVAHVSGWAAINSRPARDGFVLAIEQANEEGGINGHPVELIIYDGGSDPSRTVLAARKLIYEDKVLAVVELGVGTESAKQAMKPICQDAGIVEICTGSSLPLLERPAQWIFTEAPPHSWSQASFYGFCKERGFTRVGVLAEAYGYGLGGREVMEATAAKAGIELVAVEQFGPTDVDMTPQLSKIKAANPDVLFLYSVTMPGAIAIGQAKDMRIDVPIYTLPPILEPNFLELMPEALEGVYCFGGEGDIWWELPEDNPVRQIAEPFDAAIREKHGRAPAMMDRMGADIAVILLEAMGMANIEAEELAEARALLRDAMERVEIVGATYRYKYTPENHTGLTEPCGTLVVKEGKVSLLEWEDIKNNLYFPEGYDGLVGLQ